MKKDFLSLEDVKREEIFEIFDLTKKLRKKRSDCLKSNTFCLLFEKPSTRTRLSFEVGIKQLGGNSVFMDKFTSQLMRGESYEDTARVIERYADGIIARVYSHENLERMANCVDIPVINGISDLCHPVQILSDLFTIKEKFKSFKGLKLAYIGDGNNICNSLLLGCTKVGMNIAIACPEGFKPDRGFIDKAKDYTKVTKSDIDITTEPKKAVKDANIIYTDTFVSMGQEKDKNKRLNIFLPKYQVTEKLLNLAASDVLFMHCLPAHRGEEVTYHVIDGPRSIVFDQAENRLHVQKALLVKLMKAEIWV